MRKLVLIILLLPTLYVGYLFLKHEEATCRTVVAVWPGFQATESEPDYAILARGISWDIERYLAFSGGLIVVVTDHWDQFEGARQYAARLNADYYVDGSLEWSDDRIQISVKLVDTETGESLVDKVYQSGRNAFFDNGPASVTLQIAQDLHAVVPRSVRRTAGEPCVEP